MASKAIPGSDLRVRGGLFGERRQGWGGIKSVMRPGVSTLYSVTFRDCGEKLGSCQVLNTQGKTANDFSFLS